MKKYILFLLVAGILLAELTFQSDARIGFLLYAFLVGGVLIALSSDYYAGPSTKIIISFMILPLLRISEIFLKLSYFSRVLFIYTSLAFLVIFYTYRFEKHVGFTKRYLAWLPVAIIIGIALGVLGNYIFALDRHIELLYLMPLVAFSEEMLFRGLIQKELRENYSHLMSIFVSALLYFIFGLSYGVLIAVFFFAVSIISAIFYDKTQNIYLSIALNFCVNAIIFGFML